MPKRGRLGSGVVVAMEIVNDHAVAHVARRGAPGAEEIDLANERAQIVLLLERILERRVEDDAAVPVMLARDQDMRAGAASLIARSKVSSARLRGVAIPCRSPAATMAPVSASISRGRPARQSKYIEVPASGG